MCHGAVVRQSQKEKTHWRAFSPPDCPAEWSWCPGIQMRGRLCAVLLPKAIIFSLPITGMSAVLAKKNGAKLHLQECSLHVLDCNGALLTSLILSTGAQEKQPPDTTTELYCFLESLSPHKFIQIYFPGYTVLFF